MTIEAADVDVFHAELDLLFRDATVEADLDGPFPILWITINGAPEQITVLFDANAVVHAGWFVTEVPCERHSFGSVMLALERIAREGFHARKAPTGTVSQFGEATRTSGVLTTVSAWPRALRTERPAG